MLRVSNYLKIQRGNSKLRLPSLEFINQTHMMTMVPYTNARKAIDAKLELPIKTQSFQNAPKDTYYNYSIRPIIMEVPNATCKQKMEIAIM